MADIHVVIDSTANIAAETLAQYPNLHVVSLKVILGKQEWLETQLPSEEMFQMVARGGGHPTTSQPAVGDFLAVFEPLVKANKEIIVITIAGALSGTAQGAQLAARMIGRSDIQIIDSGTTAIGIVHLAEAALQLAKAGQSMEQIVQHLRTMIQATHTMFVPGNLDYLHKGGRIGGAAALFGTILQIKPVLYLVDGKVTVLDKVRTRPKAITRMLDELRQVPKLALVGIVHNDSLIEAEALSCQIRELYTYTSISISTIGAVLCAHLGPGIIGLVFQEEL